MQTYTYVSKGKFELMEKPKPVLMDERGVAAAALFVLVLKMDIEALPFSYAVGWLLMLLYELPMLVRFLRSSEM